MGIYDFYFNSTAEIQEKYGNRSVVFMLVGGFYEIYGLMLKDGNYNTNLYEVSQICGIVVKPKENVKKNIFMAGFPDYALDKFLKFIIITIKSIIKTHWQSAHNYNEIHGLTKAHNHNGLETHHIAFLVGIVSRGKGCGLKNRPGIYTRVESYLDWIKNEARAGNCQ